MLHRWTPFVRHFEQRHFGSTIALKLDGMIEQLELTDPDLHKFCVIDNASNMQKGIRESVYLDEYFCDNHTLQLCIKDTFDKVEGMRRLLKKCKDLAKMTHQSTSVANQQLKDKCKTAETKFAKLKNPCETRWNSYYECMKSVLRLKNPLQLLFQDDESDVWAPHALSLADWRLLQGAVHLLHPFWLATKAWEAEKTPTLNLVIERVYTLHEGLNDFFNNRNNCRLTCFTIIHI